MTLELELVGLYQGNSGVENLKAPRLLRAGGIVDPVSKSAAVEA